MPNKKILMIIAPKEFRDEEYIKPREIFEQNGYEIKVASQNVLIATGRFGSKVKIDLNLANVKIEDYIAIVFVGGSGALIYENNTQVHTLIQTAFLQNKLIAALCIAPRILASAGILKNKKMTMWNEDGTQQKIIESKGAIFTNTDVEQDGNLITANGPQSASKFAKTIVNYLEK